MVSCGFKGYRRTMFEKVQDPWHSSKEQFIQLSLEKCKNVCHFWGTFYFHKRNSNELEFRKNLFLVNLLE